MIVSIGDESNPLKNQTVEFEEHLNIINLLNVFSQMIELQLLLVGA